MPLSPLGDARDRVAVNPVFTGDGDTDGTVPRNQLPAGGLDPEVAYQLVHDELMLDGNARLNLATFVTTWMEPAARRLMDECADKNMIDKDEYPRTAALEARCVNMLARLWHAPEAGEGFADAETDADANADASTDTDDPTADAGATGCSTTGSSEAAMLAGLALLRRWRARRRAAGLPTDRPNIVMGVNVQVCWDKFARYWDVEPRLVPMAGDRYHLTAEGAVGLCDEHTIGVVAILGSTFDCSYEPVAEICAALDDLAERTGVDVPVHVDGASGAMIAPFLDPELVWDFRLPRVASINTSGHKYGLVFPGVGWVVWRTADALPDELVFRVNYLGGEMPTFALNFSRPGAQVVAQYYQFIRLGFEGYRRVQQHSRDVARRLAAGIAEVGPFTLLTDGSELPVFAFRVADGIADLTVFDVSRALRERGWLVPAYTFPADREDLAVLRIVVRNGFGHDLADLLLDDLRRVVPEARRNPVSAPADSAFHH